MDEFRYVDGDLHCSSVPIEQIAAEFGTPTYVYSAETLVSHYQRLATAFGALRPLICYSVKSCSNLAICDLLRQQGSGFDVVSEGELRRVLKIGADPKDVVFAGVGKSDAELTYALDAGVGLFNVESASELERLSDLAQQGGTVASVALRVNPDVDADAHDYTTTGRKEDKFGIDHDQVLPLIEQFATSTSVQLRGIHLHIGSPVYDPQAYVDAIDVALRLIERIAELGVTIDTLNIGGGFPADYDSREVASPEEFAHAVRGKLAGRDLKIVMEPGRLIAANAGVLVTRVLHTKRSGDKQFLVTDAAMNDLLRPALYGAYHFIWPVHAGGRVPTTREARQSFDGLSRYDVVGPVCESGDFFARDRELPAMQRGDLLAVFSAGAYGMSMASQYNSRPRPAEVLVEQSDVRLIRRREQFEDVIAAEIVPAAR